MSYEFKKLSEVDIVQNAPDGSHLLVEFEDEIKRVPMNQVGSDTGTTFIVKDATFFDLEAELTYEANMTVEELDTAFHSGKLTNAILYLNRDSALITCPLYIADVSTAYGTTCYALMYIHVDRLGTTSGSQMSCLYYWSGGIDGNGPLGEK